MTVVGIISLHIFHIILLLRIPHQYVFPFKLENSAYESWINASIILTPLIFLFLLFFRKTVLESYPVKEEDIKKAKKIIPIYFLISFLGLIALLIREGIIRGTL
jgi:amino acid transporter